ncbi:GNAT family N-acetyltransferase [uncultured Chitinophaga sp.]|uniref:GNAT family N-acetyltransferase n=1 Tax=uncultured Chitinophaga sp. TaxID=339340 RepID=UPI0025E1C799|nr:GNAT family N-acetyltransferase [uncultured Chitinophaga sp.]
MRIGKTTPNDYPAIVHIWASSVKATHHFLKEEDFLFFQEVIPAEYLPQLEVYLLDDKGPKAFIAVAGDSLEMLFVAGEERGRGYGKVLLQFAINELGVTRVDVNEQNEQAVGFYNRMGFVQTGRSAVDGTGRPYPIIHMAIRG